MLACALLSSFLLSAPQFVFGRSISLVTQDPDRPNAEPYVDIKVPVQLGVASKDSSALLCHRIFDQVIDRVSNKMDISLVYVATLNDTEPDFGVTCQNGPEECAGNVQQLCVRKYVPDEWWHFVHCQNYQGSGKVGNPDVAFRCAKASQFDWELSGVGECAGPDASGRGEEGVKLLQNSVRLAERMNIDTSCSILISGEEVCIHDGNWRRCENGHGVSDFVKQINTEYERLNA